MAYEFYVTVEGTKQGKFKQETYREEHAGKIAGIGFRYSVLSPRDAATGMAGGKRIHRPISFVKQWGAASPQFFQALCTNEILKSVLFEFVKPDPDGQEYVFHTIKVTNASVSEIEQYVEDEAPGNEAHEAQPLEKISMTFQKIELENKDGQTTAADDWFGGH